MDEFDRAVVPARAGVIPLRHPHAAAQAGRPRASGGHPCGGHPAEQEYLNDQRKSSPRERGSSHCVRSVTGGGLVVPARAGVIPTTGTPRTAGARRPRASGGHPALVEQWHRHHQSSPRERGSSLPELRAVVIGHVVPARAGVIRRWRRSCGGSGRRPRASGGHPGRVTVTGRLGMSSSPRERGSSPTALATRHAEAVVPARAGVIPRRTRSRWGRGCRPRASVGHPASCSGWPPSLVS